MRARSFEGSRQCARRASLTRHAHVVTLCRPTRHVVAQARNGTGKTLAFVLGALCRLDPRMRDTQIVVVSHTRELTRQTFDVFQSLAPAVGGSVRLLVPVSGVPEPVTEQIVVGTPGALKFAVEKGRMRVDKVKV